MTSPGRPAISLSIRWTLRASGYVTILRLLETAEAYQPRAASLIGSFGIASVGGEAPSEISASLALQARHLFRNIEWHLLGNHLFANIKAMILQPMP